MRDMTAKIIMNKVKLKSFNENPEEFDKFISDNWDKLVSGYPKERPNDEYPADLNMCRKGGDATKVSKESRTTLKYPYPVYIMDIIGEYVQLDNGHLLFTESGYVTFNKVLREYKLEHGDELLVENLMKIWRGNVIIKRKGEDIVSPEELAITLIRENREGETTLYLVSMWDQRIHFPQGSEFAAQKDSIVEAEKTLVTFDPSANPIIAKASGTVKYHDIILGSTFKEEINEDTGITEKRIMELAKDQHDRIERILHYLFYGDYNDKEYESKMPRIHIVDDNGKEVTSYVLSGGAYIMVDEGERVCAGQTIAEYR